MSEMKNKIKLFADEQVRSVWDEETEKWWYSVVDVVDALTDQPAQSDASAYWAALKKRLAKEGAGQLLTNCKQMEMEAADGKKGLTDVVDMEQILRLVQSIPGKKAGSFRELLAKAGSERIDEIIDPELSIDRAVQGYRRLGYSETWINNRLKSIVVRKATTDKKRNPRGNKSDAELLFRMFEEITGTKITIVRQSVDSEQRLLPDTDKGDDEK